MLRLSLYPFHLDGILPRIPVIAVIDIESSSDIIDNIFNMQ